MLAKFNAVDNNCSELRIIHYLQETVQFSSPYSFLYKKKTQNNNKNAFILSLISPKKIMISKKQAPVVQKVDNAIQWINHYPVNYAIGFPNTYNVGW